MKRTLFVMLIAAVILSAGCVSQQPQSGTYENTNYGFRMNYAQGWEKLDGAEGVQVAFVSPPESATDDFQENVNVNAQPVQTDMTLEGYESLVIQALSQSVPDFDLVSAKDSELGGTASKELVYTGTGKNGPVKLLQAFALKDKTVYAITFIAKQETYDAYLSEARAMIDSFQFAAKEEPKTNTDYKTAGARAEEGKWRAEEFTRLLELRNNRWTFSSSSGLYTIGTIEPRDWDRWGVQPYGPTRKIILFDWNKDIADGPIEETQDGIDFIWVIYKADPSAQGSRYVWLKFMRAPSG